MFRGGRAIHARKGLPTRDFGHTVYRTRSRYLFTPRQVPQPKRSPLISKTLAGIIVLSSLSLALFGPRLSAPLLYYPKHGRNLLELSEASCHAVPQHFSHDRGALSSIFVFDDVEAALFVGHPQKTAVVLEDVVGQRRRHPIPRFRNEIATFLGACGIVDVDDS